MNENTNEITKRPEPYFYPERAAFDDHQLMAFACNVLYGISDEKMPIFTETFTPPQLRLLCSTFGGSLICRNGEHYISRKEQPDLLIDWYEEAGVFKFR